MVDTRLLCPFSGVPGSRQSMSGFPATAVGWSELSDKARLTYKRIAIIFNYHLVNYRRS